MKKFSYISLIFVLVVSFISISTPAKASMLDIDNTEGTIQPYDLGTLHNLVKKDGKRQCMGDARSINQDDIIDDSTNESEIEALAASEWTSQIRTSDKGSRIVMPFIPFANLGYCHIFEGHMQWANGIYVETVNYSTQFAIAMYPTTLMDAIMQSIDGTATLTPVPGNANRKIKTAYSSIVGHKIKVVIQKGDSINPYGAYDWVIITAHPA